MSDENDVSADSLLDQLAQVANAEVTIKKTQNENKEGVYDVEASLVFNRTVAEYYEIPLGVKEAIFRVKVNNGKMPQKDHCYIDSEFGEIIQEDIIKNNSSVSARFGALLKGGIRPERGTGLDTSIGAKAGCATSRESNSYYKVTRINKIYSVIGRGNKKNTGVSEWFIYSNLSDQPIRGEVFAKSDDGCRHLGKLETETPQKCSIEPTLEIRYQAIMPIISKNKLNIRRKEKVHRKKVEKLLNLLIEEDRNPIQIFFDSANLIGV